ncbi:mandelate racemase/muconate lactonizing enzyme family protein [Petrimonas sp.]|uniref:mandelate racemase/muconate lactonizing enzyme family protein n=1 Tax=Petrimonas sp. TaxID=2023866 RepID=UPI002FC5AC54|nr:mandelate racemase/muconate lactonizing enzyme family protein [Prolixibacteraceae bacterium]
MSDIIKKIEAFPISIPREVPYLGKLEEGNSYNEKGYFIRPGNRSIYSINDQSLLVKVTTRTGEYGWGECVAFYVPEVCATIISELIGPLLIGRSVHDVVKIYEDLYDAMRVRGFFGGFYHDAIASVDIALWDLHGKLLNLPVCKVLGSKRHEKMPAYVSGLPMPTLDERVEMAKAWVAKGFDAIKFASAVSHEGIIEEMKALREALGPRVKLLVDLHWKFTAAEAIKLIRQLNQYDLYVAEAPLKPEDIEGQSLVVRSVNTQVGIGEELRTVYEYRPRFENSCMHVIQPEMGRTGLTSFRDICQMSVAFNHTVMPHASIGIGIFQAASLQASAALQNLVYHEYQHSIFDKNLKYVKTSMKCEDGYFTVPQEPGLGIEPEEEVFNFIKK